MKILFLQYWADMYGGAETVNDTLIREFNKNGYKASLLCLWNGGMNEIIDNINYDKFVINNKPFKVSKKECLNKLIKLKFCDAINDIKINIKSVKDKKKDIKCFKNKIDEINPDFIIITNWELIKFIDKKYLNKCIFHMHSGFAAYFSFKDKKCIKYLKKYQHKIKKIIWLTPSFKDKAISYGFDNSEYMYNPVRFKSDKVSNLDSKIIAFIGRLNEVKRVDKLCNIVSKLDNDYELHIYGDGDRNSIIESDKVKLMGSTNNVKDVLLTSSVLALTSRSEGFPMVILEAYECGVPVIAFNYGISSCEAIINNKTGFIIDYDDEDEYLNKLKELCNNDNLRKELGKAAKEYATNFKSEEVVKRWFMLFEGKL